jgi:hypothetical protein
MAQNLATQQCAVTRVWWCQQPVGPWLPNELGQQCGFCQEGGEVDEIAPVLRGLAFGPHDPLVRFLRCQCGVHRQDDCRIVLFGGEVLNACWSCRLSFCMFWAGTRVTPRGSLVVYRLTCSVYKVCVCVAGIYVQVCWLWVWFWTKLPGFYQICCERLLAAGSMHATPTRLLPLSYATMLCVLCYCHYCLLSLVYLLCYCPYMQYGVACPVGLLVRYWLVMVIVGAHSACHNLTWRWQCAGSCMPESLHLHTDAASVVACFLARARVIRVPGQAFQLVSDCVQLHCAAVTCVHSTQQH